MTRAAHIAIIGSGPSGFYAAEALMRSGRECRVDLFERLPAPHGLVRYGVAPDHQKLKSVAAVFDRIATHPGVGWFGGIEIGRDLPLETLRSHYHAVVLACGAPVGRRLGVPGEDLPGVVTSDRFVGWYNGHPDHHAFDVAGLDVNAALVVGHGNVAIDVCR
ncbi:MAG: FAD/NAD(P)-binding protein, partial [Burkholderiales bacterium]|nr:FAD/NAD(P)-binding protein [Burkholderiales bacterium]